MTKRSSRNGGVDDFTKAAMRRADFIRERADLKEACTTFLDVRTTTMGKKAATIGYGLTMVLTAIVVELSDGSEWDEAVSVAAIGVLMQDSINHSRDIRAGKDEAGKLRRLRKLGEILGVDVENPLSSAPEGTS